MKKIMFYRSLYYMGGTEIAILNLIKNLTGYEILIGYNDETSDIHLLNKYKLYAKVIKIDENFNEHIDTLIISSPYKSALEIHNIINRDKTILWFHHFGNRESSIFNDDSFYNIIDTIVPVSESCRNELLRQNYAEKIKNKIEVIYNIINTDDIINKSNIETNLDFSHQLNLVSVGRVCYEKGFDRQLRLARLLKEKNIDFIWYIVGGNYYKEIEAEIENKYNDLNNNFVFTGFLDNPYNIIKHCDYLVLLSDNETWGLVLTEAKILKVPCIVTDFDVAFEQITDNNTGIILSRDNLDSYADKISSIIDNKQFFKNNLKDFIWSNDISIQKWNEIL